MRTSLQLLICALILSTIVFFFCHIKFLNKPDLFDILSNRDYLNKLSKMDLYVRGVKNIEEYIQNNIRTSVSFTSFYEKIKLICLILIVDIQVLLSNSTTEFFDKIKYVKIPWKIGIVDGDLYEDGLPHTRNGNIILSRDTIRYSSNQHLLQLLLHEKVHVYQYFNKGDVQKYIKSKNLKRVKKNKRVRANPDIDDYTYEDSSGNKYQAIYRDNATSISDVDYEMGNSQFYEHPYESMAIQLEKILK